MNFLLERMSYNHRIAKRGSAGNKWEGINISWREPVLPYENNDVKVFSMPKLDPINPGTCPHCGMNHGRILREARDIFCINCGWRDTEYYNIQLNKFIRWINELEDKYGKPELLSDIEQRDKNTSKRWYEANKDRLLALNDIWVKGHRNRVNEAKKRRYYTPKYINYRKAYQKEYSIVQKKRYQIKKLIKILKERCKVC